MMRTQHIARESAVRLRCTVCQIVCCFESEAHLERRRGVFEKEHLHRQRMPIRAYYTLSLKEELEAVDGALARLAVRP